MATIKRSRWNAKTDTSSGLRTVLIHGRPRGKVVSTIFQSLRIPGESMVHGNVKWTIGTWVVQPFRLGRWWNPRGPRGCDEDASRAKRAERGTHDQRAHRRIAATRRSAMATRPQASAEKHRYFVNQGTGPFAAMHFGFTPLRFYRHLRTRNGWSKNGTKER